MNNGKDNNGGNNNRARIFKFFDAVCCIALLIFLVSFIVAFYDGWGQMKQEEAEAQKEAEVVEEVPQYDAVVTLLDTDNDYQYTITYERVIEYKTDGRLGARYLIGNRCVLEYSGDTLRLPEYAVAYRGSYTIDGEDPVIEEPEPKETNSEGTAK